VAHLSTKSEYAIRALVGLALADGAERPAGGERT